MRPKKPRGRAPQLDYEAAPSKTAADSAVRIILLLAVVGLAARGIIAAYSWGTSDSLGFLRFGYAISKDGLLATYRSDPELNHPPIPAYWAWLSVALSRPSAFVATLLMRLPAILADIGSAFILWRIWSARAVSGKHAATIVALFCWSPIALLISGYHGNTDSVYAFLCLLSCYLLQERMRAGLAGIALAAAINVKLIPILIAAPLAAGVWRRRSSERVEDLVRLILGASAAVLPFIPLLLLGGTSFRHNVLAYRSRVDLWGINFFLSLVEAPNETGGLPLPPMIGWYRVYGRWLIIALVIGWSIIAARKPGRWNAYDRACVALSIFLILAPGFGVQYLVAVLPLLFAARPRIALAYSLAGGAFLLTAYFVFWDGELPFSSLFDRLFPMPVAILGLIPWVMLIFYVALTLARGSLAAPSAQDAKQ